jgi:hypothetical protein
MMEKAGKAKFYADAPDGKTVNKYFVYEVYDFDHACDLIGRFQANGWKIRAAYYVFRDTGKSIKILKGLIDQAAEQSFYQLRRETEIRLQMLERQIDPQKAAEIAAAETQRKFEEYLKSLDGNK